VDHNVEAAAVVDIDEMPPPMDSDQRIANNSSERNELVDSAIQKIFISIIRMRNACSASFPNKGKLFRAVLPVRAHTISVNL
jgi:hypothetical protein